MTRLHNGTFGGEAPIEERWADFIVHYDQRLHPARGIVRGLMVGAAVWALLIFSAIKLHGQVDARLVLRGRDASMTVANPSQASLHVAITLFVDSTLVDSVPARISPSAFTLEPGRRQVVRLRLQSPAPSGSAFRLATLFLPAEKEETPTMAIRLAVRMLTRVVAEAGP